MDPEMCVSVLLNSTNVPNIDPVSQLMALQLIDKSYHFNNIRFPIYGAKA
jgi:hypothetical protein